MGAVPDGLPRGHDAPQTTGAAVQLIACHGAGAGSIGYVAESYDRPRNPWFKDESI